VNRIGRQKRKENIEGGLNMSKFTKLQTSRLFILPSEGAIFLGVKDDDIEKAIEDSVKLSLEIINNQKIDLIDMKGE
ncbi:MAG: nucleoside-diphosphate sugar epimerase, partial [Bacilli bacterium]|nr:nucleoside-diphosphate sugar epimerase [Bacilli bacterium]